MAITCISTLKEKKYHFKSIFFQFSGQEENNEFPLFKMF